MPTLEYDDNEVCVSIDFEVFCAECGHGMCRYTTTGRTNRRGMPYIRVEPCPVCQGKEYQRGVEVGQQSKED